MDVQSFRSSGSHWANKDLSRFNKLAYSLHIFLSVHCNLELFVLIKKFLTRTLSLFFRYQIWFDTDRQYILKCSSYFSSYFIFRSLHTGKNPFTNISTPLKKGNIHD